MGAAIGGLVLLPGEPVAATLLLGAAAGGLGWAQHRHRQEQRRIAAEQQRRAAERALRARERRGRLAQLRRYARDPVTGTSPLPRPWHHRVQRARDAVADFELAITHVRPGPLRERLEDARPTVHGVGRSCEDLARQACELERRLRGDHRASWSARAQRRGEREQQARSDLRQRLDEVTRTLDERVGSLRTMALRSAEVLALQALSGGEAHRDDARDVVGSLDALVAALHELRPPARDRVLPPRTGTEPGREQGTATT